MKKNYFLIILLLFLGFILGKPSLAAAAASDGLLLWYRQILPALLPLAILSHIMISSNYMQLLTKYLYPLTRPFFATSQSGCFALLGGILFGFPMGSKICADLVKENKISCEEGELLAICCNQLSPVFISSYLFDGILHLPGLILPGYLLIYLPPLSYAAYHLHRMQIRHTKNPASDSHLDFGIIDAGIMNGLEALTKLGGYIVLFSIFAAMLHACNTAHPAVNLICTGLVEVTTGISGLSSARLPGKMLFSLSVIFVSFGGLCGFAQTCSMTKGSHFSMSRYLICRITFALCSGTAAWLLFPLFDLLRLC